MSMNATFSIPWCRSPCRSEKIVIDLDVGVKVNYVKSGAVLEKISGLEAKEE